MDLERMADRASRAADAYARAKQFAEAHFPLEIEWQRGLSIESITESDFLRESAWVIFCSGFRERTIRACFDYLSLCFCDWESGAVISANAQECRAGALAAFNNTRKIDAVLKISARIACEGFVTVKRHILSRPIDELQKLPYIGPITAYHLAKNLGLPVAKPDRHLQRLATTLEYSDVHALCWEISTLTGDPPQVVDLVLWRYMAETSMRKRSSMITGLVWGASYPESTSAPGTTGKMLRGVHRGVCSGLL
jgi:hypothetical protein